MLGLRARNQHVPRDAKFAPIEFLTARNILRGLTLHPLVQIAAIVQPLHLAEVLFGMGEEVDALAMQRVREQHFGGQARHGHGGIFEERGALEECGLNRHQAGHPLRLTSPLWPVGFDNTP